MLPGLYFFFYTLLQLIVLKSDLTLGIEEIFG